MDPVEGWRFINFSQKTGHNFHPQNGLQKKGLDPLKVRSGSAKKRSGTNKKSPDPVKKDTEPQHWKRDYTV